MNKNIFIILLLVALISESCAQEEVPFEAFMPYTDVQDLAPKIGIKKAVFKRLSTPSLDRALDYHIYEFDKEGRLRKGIYYKGGPKRPLRKNIKSNTKGVSLSLTALGHWFFSASEKSYIVINYNEKELPISRFHIGKESGDTLKTSQFTYYDNDNPKSAMVYSEGISRILHNVEYNSKNTIKSRIDFNPNGFVKKAFLLDGQDTLYRIFCNYHPDNKHISQVYRKSFIRIEGLFEPLKQVSYDVKFEKKFFNNKESIQFYDIQGDWTYEKVIPGENDWNLKTFYDDKGRPSYQMYYSSNSILSQKFSDPILSKKYFWEGDKLTRIESYTTPEKGTIYIDAIREFDDRGNLVRHYRGRKGEMEYYKSIVTSDDDPYRYIKTKNGLVLFAYYEYDKSNNLKMDGKVFRFFKLYNDMTKHHYEVINDTLYVTRYRLKEGFGDKMLPRDFLENQEKYFEKEERYIGDMQEYKEKNPSYSPEPIPYIKIEKYQKTSRPLWNSEERGNTKFYRNNKGLVTKITEYGKISSIFKYDRRGAMIEAKEFNFNSGELDENIKWEFEYW